MEIATNEHEHEPLPDNLFGFWFLDRGQKRGLNFLTILFQLMLVLQFFMVEQMTFFMLLFSSMMLIGVRTWWIWW